VLDLPDEVSEAPDLAEACPSLDGSCYENIPPWLEPNLLGIFVPGDGLPGSGFTIAGCFFIYCGSFGNASGHWFLSLGPGLGLSASASLFMYPEDDDAICESEGSVALSGGIGPLVTSLLAMIDDEGEHSNGAGGAGLGIGTLSVSMESTVLISGC
jgi:hypothetical protein